MDQQTIHLLLRATAGTSFLFFLGAFVGGTVFRLWPAPITRWLDETRRGWILAFAASHTVHLGFIVALAMTLGSTEFIRGAGWAFLVLGGTGYLSMYGLAAATVFPSNVKRLRSPRFQAFAHYLIWFIFALTFVGRALQTGRKTSAAFAVVAAAALVLRIIAAIQSRKVAALSAAAR